MARKRYKINYALGDCFSVPVRNGGYACGLVARMDGKGGIFGHFFGPRVQTFEDIRIDPVWRPGHAALVCKFGDLGLVEGEWKVLGPFPKWRIEDWPFPRFVRYVEIREGQTVAFVTDYDEHTFRSLGEQRMSVEEAKMQPFVEDSLHGYGAVEITLDRLLP